MFESFQFTHVKCRILNLYIMGGYLNCKLVLLQDSAVASFFRYASELSLTVLTILATFYNRKLEIESILILLL